MGNQGERLYQLRTFYGYSQRKLAEETGISTSSISKAESGRKDLTHRQVKTVCGILQADINWFMTGHGDMFTKSKYTEEFSEHYDKLNPQMKKLAIKIVKDLLEYQDNQ